jgi:glycosyltransferase involved in cell wall biosynthesis
MLFFTPSIEELFELLTVSHSANIIINSLYGYPDITVAAANIVSLTRTLKAKLDFKIHDFYALCPSPHLSNFEDKYCGVPDDVEVCRQCLKKNLSWYHSWYPKENRPTDIVEWRKPFAELFDSATTITFFDISSVDIARKAFHLEESKVKVIPHSINHVKCDTQIALTGSLHIGILGTLSHMKGGNVVKLLCEYIDEQGLDIPITVVGANFSDIPPRVTVHGKYTPNDLPLIISKRGINVILIPSIIPETFSYTISEAIEMGLPIVAFDLGAQGNRVKQYALGKVIPLDSSPAVILAAIQSVLKMAQEKK